MDVFIFIHKRVKRSIDYRRLNRQKLSGKNISLRTAMSQACKRKLTLRSDIILQSNTS